MADGKASVAQVALQFRRELQQAQSVGDDHAAAAHFGSGLFLGEIELFDQLGVAARFLDGVEVFALEIFDQGQFQDGAIIGLADDDRHFGQADHLRGAPAAFPRRLTRRSRLFPDDERLYDALFPNGIRQLAESLGGKVLARLQWTGAKLGDGNALDKLRGSALGGRKRGHGAAGLAEAPMPPSMRSSRVLKLVSP